MYKLEINIIVIVIVIETSAAAVDIKQHVPVWSAYNTVLNTTADKPAIDKSLSIHHAAPQQ